MIINDRLLMKDIVERLIQNEMIITEDHNDEV